MNSELIERPPNADVQKVEFDVPKGSCDSHFHVFETPDKYPFSSVRNYTPAVATDSNYRQLARSLGLQRAVLVQPSPYGSDNTLLKELLRDNANYRGIAVIGEQTPSSELKILNGLGVRGIRISVLPQGAGAIQTLRRLSKRIAEYNWHLQLYIGMKALMELKDELVSLSTAVVLDHFGGLQPHMGINSTEFSILAKLLATGRVWVKISGAYRVSSDGPPYMDTVEIARLLIDAAPERVVWGTDWPHSYLRGKPMPDDGQLLNLLAQCAPCPQHRVQILATNPRVLYNFND
jgi:2-pyrone-4,6-dicarboxylate lactonase